MYNHKNGITLRKAESFDLATLLIMKQETWWGTHGTSIINSEDQQNWYEKLPSDCMVLVGEQENQNCEEYQSPFLGVCIISDIDWVARSANISGAVDKGRRSLDLCRQAFEAGLDFAFEMLNLRRLGAEVTEYNYPAQIIEISHLGFTIEGIRRSCVYKCGQYYNSLMLSIFQEEWSKQDRIIQMNGSCNNNFDHKLNKKMINRSRRTFGWNCH